MRILMVTNSYGPALGGVEVSIALFVRELRAAGHDVYVAAPARDGYVDTGPFVFRLPSITIPGDTIDGAVAVRAKPMLDMLVRGIRPHVIHSHHPFLLGDTAADLAGATGIPLVYTFHTRYAEYAQEHFPRLAELTEGLITDALRRYMARCDLVVAPSPGIAELLQRDYPTSTPVVVIPTPVDPAIFEGAPPAADLGLPAGAEIVLYAGRLVVEKNLDLLVRAFARVAMARPHAVLVMAGTGPAHEHLEDLASFLRIAARIRFLGRIPHREVPALMTAARVFAFASTTETQGLVLLEAMAAGTPVVAVEASGTRDVLAEGGGLLVSDDARALGDGIVALLEDDALRSRLSEQGREASRRFAPQQAVNSLVAAYEAAAGRRGSAQAGVDDGPRDTVPSS